MYLWDETIAKRGSSEVASCLLKHITENSTGARYNAGRLFCVICCDAVIKN